jgi:uncharacterized surface protein with fasciclin (FAS1) repeats
LDSVCHLTLQGTILDLNQFDRCKLSKLSVPKRTLHFIFYYFGGGMRKRNFKRTEKASYERFEERLLLAGDVRVVESGNNVFIFGDRASNQVEVMAAPNGDVVVGGLDGTTINGQTEPMVLRDRGGELGGVRTNLGAGDDLLRIEGVGLEGSAIVFGGAGDDAIGLYNTRILDQLFVQTAGGSDSISLDNVGVGSHLSIFSLSGNDRIGIDQSQISGRTTLLGGGGADDISIRDSTHEQAVFAFLQSGNDFIGTDGLSAGSYVGVFGGGGADDVYIGDTSIAGPTVVRGGGGSDQVELNGVVDFASDPRISSVEGNDVAGGLIQRDQVFTNLIMDGARLGTITELAVMTPQLSTLVGALQATGLDEPLNGPGSFTAFAPLNSAFDALPPGTVAGLSTEQLTDILSFHVVGRAVPAAELVMLNSVDTLLGQPLSVDLSTGSPVLNGNVTIAQTDIRAKNGIIHLINGVLIPGSDAAA